MLNIFGRFIKILFVTCLTMFLVLNLLNFANNPHGDTYFGFRSLLNAFNDSPQLDLFDQNSGFYGRSLYLPSQLTQLYNDALGFVVKLFQQASQGEFLDIIGYFQFLISFFLAPIYVFIDLTIFLISALKDIISIVVWVFNFLLGTYNVTVPIV